MSHVEDTECCGLGHLRCNDDDTINEMKESMNDYLISEKSMDSGDKFTFMAITREDEEELEKKLKKIGFEHKHTIPSYSSPGKELKMWFYTHEEE